MWSSVESSVWALCVCGAVFGSVFTITKCEADRQQRKASTMDACIGAGKAPMECRKMVEGPDKVCNYE